MIDVDYATPLAILTLNAPKKLNSMDEEDLRQLHQAIRDIHARVVAGEIRSLLLRGEGRAFCAGRDISKASPTEDDALGFLQDIFTPILHDIRALPVPTFAAVQGACLGLGLGLAAACDVVYISEDATIGSPFLNLGATLDSGGHYWFVERLGSHRALDLIYTGDMISGAEAVSHGLFSRALPAEELQDFALKKARKAADGPREAMLASKKMVAEFAATRPNLDETIRQENINQDALSRTNEYAEGFRAFQNKRQGTKK